MTTTEALALSGRLGMDAVCLLVLVGWLHRRRTSAPEMALVFTALNMGLFAAVSVIGVGDFPAGVGFGLFGLLSLVRLRSAAFTLKDVAYTFLALVLALVNALPGRDLALVALLDVVLLVAVWVADETRTQRPTRVMRVTMDRAMTDLELIRQELELRWVPASPDGGMSAMSVVIDDIDFVRETTRVSVRYEIADAWWQRREAEAGDTRLDSLESTPASGGAER